MVQYKELVAFDERVASFRAHRVGGTAKRSALKAWPHSRPSVTQMARAGFIYNPSAESPDNVTCFLCDKDLDGWTEKDDPKIEHLDHSPRCAWAIIHSEEWRDDDLYDPDAKEIVKARLETFGTWWPHDAKRGWVPTSDAMSKAGFYYNAGRSGDDIAACAYCNVILDGWEPKDIPEEEHRRRSPNCFYFTRVHKPRRNSKARESRKTTSRKRASSGSVDDSELEAEPKPKRRTSKRNSKASSDEADESSASQRRLFSLPSKDISMSSAPTESIVEEDEPEVSQVPLKRARGPRAMKLNAKKEVETPPKKDIPPVPPLPDAIAVAEASTEVNNNGEDTRENSRRQATSPTSARRHAGLVAERNAPSSPSRSVREAEKSESPGSLTSIARSPRFMVQVDSRSRERTPADKQEKTPAMTPKTDSKLNQKREMLSVERSMARSPRFISQADSRSEVAAVQETSPARLLQYSGSPKSSPSKSTPKKHDQSIAPAADISQTVKDTPHALRSPVRIAMATSPTGHRVLTDSSHNGNVSSPTRSSQKPWTRKSLTEICSDEEDTWRMIMGAEDVASMDKTQTVEEWIKSLAEKSERALLAKCDALVEKLEQEAARAIAIERSYQKKKECRRFRNYRTALARHGLGIVVKNDRPKRERHEPDSPHTLNVDSNLSNAGQTVPKANKTPFYDMDKSSGSPKRHGWDT